MHGRILIVGETASDRINYTARLNAAFYQALLAPAGSAGLRMTLEQRPDVVLVDLDMHSQQASGIELITALRRDPRIREIPVIALVAPQGDSRLAALRAGADAVLPRPVNEPLLLARIRSLMRRRQAAGLVASAWGERAPELLGTAFELAEEDTPFLALQHRRNPASNGEIALIAGPDATPTPCAERLAERLREQLRHLSRDEALQLVPDPDAASAHLQPVAAARPPELIVIELDRSDGQSGAGGLRLMAQLAARDIDNQIAFCLITPAPVDPKCDDLTAAMALDLGAADVLPADLGEEEIVLRLRAILRRKRQSDRMRATVENGLRLALIDPLTGCYNRRFALPRLAGIAADAIAEHTEFAVIMFDLDRFKRVNDQYGHAAGDAVLAAVARLLTENLRLSDLLARIGGEEFLIVLPRTSCEEAGNVAERLRKLVSAHPIPLPDGRQIAVTISIGVTFGPLPGLPPERIGALIEKADCALRGSKNAGRNIVSFCRSGAGGVPPSCRTMELDSAPDLALDLRLHQPLTQLLARANAVHCDH